MKNTQQGFIGIVLIIIAALAVGGGLYYHQQTLKKNVAIDTSTDFEAQKDTAEQDSKNIPPKKPITVSFEAKARASAQTSECTEWGTIGAATKLDEGNQYAVFTIDNSLIPTTRNTCVVDLYADTAEAPLEITAANIPGPRKIEPFSIKAARSIANAGACSKEGIVTSFTGYVDIYGGGQSVEFRVSSLKDKSEIGMCDVNVERNTSQFLSPIR